MKTYITLLLPDVRSAQNVGAIMRTADAVGARIWTSGITPYPIIPGDPRPAHIADRAHHLINKTALGAQDTVFERHFESYIDAVEAAQKSGMEIWALEQSDQARNLFDATIKRQVLLVVGTEVTGLTAPQLDLCDTIWEIPMIGLKESLNVSVAAGIAMYHLTGVSTKRRTI